MSEMIKFCFRNANEIINVDFEKVRRIAYQEDDEILYIYFDGEMIKYIQITKEEYEEFVDYLVDNEFIDYITKE